VNQIKLVEQRDWESVAATLATARLCWQESSQDRSDTERGHDQALVIVAGPDGRTIALHRPVKSHVHSTKVFLVLASRASSRRISRKSLLPWSFCDVLPREAMAE
jgi:hypothetical protein